MLQSAASTAYTERICKSSGALPYAYVSVEGTVSGIRPGTTEDTLAMAVRYLGDDMGKGYAEANADNNSVMVSIRPERWLTVDYAKAG